MQFQIDKSYLNPSCGATIVTRHSETGRIDVRIEYSREFMLAASASPYALLAFDNLPKILNELPEVITTFPKDFYSTYINKETRFTSI